MRVAGDKGGVVRVGVTRLGLMRVGWWLQGMGWGGEGGVVRVWL